MVQVDSASRPSSVFSRQCQLHTQQCRHAHTYPQLPTTTRAHPRFPCVLAAAFHAPSHLLHTCMTWLCLAVGIELAPPLPAPSGRARRAQQENTPESSPFTHLHSFSSANHTITPLHPPPPSGVMRGALPVAGHRRPLPPFKHELSNTSPIALRSADS